MKNLCIHVARAGVQTSKYFLSLLALVVFCLPVAMAQPSSEASDEEAGDRLLEEVVVTARKREESPLEVPMGLTAVNSDMIERMQLNSIDDIARLAPGLSFSKAFGRSAERPVIRGASNVLANVQFGVESGAAYFVDGIYYTGSVQNLDIQDIERVEVIRGPQSALYGRNTYSGAINFVTKSPGESDGFSASFGIGSQQRLNSSFSFAEKVNDAHSWRMSLRQSEYGGEWKNEVTGDESLGGERSLSLSGVYAFDGERLKLRARMQLNRDRDETRAFFLQPPSVNNCHSQYLYDPASDSSSPSATAPSLYYCGAIEPRPVALNDRDFSGTATELNELATRLGYTVPRFFPFSIGTDAAGPFSGVMRDVRLFSLGADFDLGGGYTLVGALSYKGENLKTGSDSDHSPINVSFSPVGQRTSTIYSGDDDEYRDFSFDLRLESPAEQALRWRAGLFYYTQEIDEFEVSRAASNGTQDGEDELVNTALYAGLEWDLSERMELSLEVRSQSEEKEVKELNAAGATTSQQKGDWDKVNPRLTLSYDLSDDMMVYAVLAQGSKPGGLNGATGVETGRPTYEQETSENLEFGFKSRWQNVLLNVAAYFNKLQDIQVTEAVPTPTGASNSIASNQGEGEVTGLELDATWLINESFDLTFNYALAQTEFTKGCDDTQYVLTAGLASGSLPSGFIATFEDATTATRTSGTGAGRRQLFTDWLAAGMPNEVSYYNPSGQASCSIVGNQFAFAPETMWSLAFNYDQQSGDGLQLFAGVDVSFEDKKYAQVHNGAFIDEVTLFNARVGLGGRLQGSEEEGAWRLTLFGRNLTDEDTPVHVTRWVSPAFGTSPRYFFANPRQERSFGLEFAMNF